jgi:peptidoglycan/xylan/chitin deacetylase (PgdA/CDA1 family)
LTVRELRNTQDSLLYNKGREAMERLGPMGLEEPAWVSPAFLRGLDPRLFTVGLHGHEHQRFSMMNADWQKRDLMANLEQLADLPCYAPLFAVPFGRHGDWGIETKEIAEELGLTMLLADGGLNDGPSDLIRRIPSDNLRLFEILCRA